jgi:hypothetical protein
MSPAECAASVCGRHNPTAARAVDCGRDTTRRAPPRGRSGSPGSPIHNCAVCPTAGPLLYVGEPAQVSLYLGSRAAYAGAFSRDPQLHFDDVALRSPCDLGRGGWRISPAGEPRPRYHALPPCTSEVTPSLGALSDKVRAPVPNPITRVVPSDAPSRAAPL